MSRLLSFAVLFFALAAALPAQGSFTELRARLERERAEFMQEKRGRPSFDDVRQIAERHAELVASWLTTAKGAEAVNGRLLLADILLNTGNEARARDVLEALDPSTAPALELAAAAEMAGMLGMQAQRDAWIDVAVAKDAPFDDRMSLGMFLMTRLVEIEKGEAIFAAAVDAATDDEGRAKVLWYRAAAIREREDLAEGAFEIELETLAAEYPDTYWGGIARDRRAAFDLNVGVEAIPFRAKTLSGEDVQLSDYAGKVVLIDFWSTDRMRGRPVHQVIATMQAEFGAKGFEVLGVAMDTDRAAVQKAIDDRKTTWPQVFDGRGFQTDVALRYGIEGCPDHVLVGRDGKVAAKGVFLQDDYGVRELREAIERALGDG